MNKTLEKFFVSKGFEIVEKKTTTQILIENLLAFSVREKKGELLDVSINIVKEDVEKEKLRKRSRGFNLNLDKTPLLSNVSVASFIHFCNETKVVSQIKRLSEFREVQYDFTLDIAKKEGKTLKWRSNLLTEKHHCKEHVLVVRLAFLFLHTYLPLEILVLL